MKIPLIATLAFTFAATALGQMPPKGFTIPDNTHSPDGRYGVTVPIRAEQPDDDSKTPEPRNSLVNIKEGKVLAVIDAETGYDRQSHGGIVPMRWAADGSVALWQVEGKWMRDAIVVLRIEGDKMVWQMEVLKAAQQAMLERTRQAEPKRYAVAKKANEGSGSAYPEGFTIDARIVGKLTFPLRVQAALTSDPKGTALEVGARLYSHLEGTVDAKGKFTVTAFHVDKTMSAYDKLEEIEPLTD